MDLPPKTIRLHQAQADFRHSDAIYRGFVGGRGAGKSWCGAYDLIRRAKRGRLYMAVGPTYTSLQDTSLRTFLGIARDLNMIVAENVKRSPPPMVRLSTGAEILFRSADEPDKLRGPNLSGAWMDEASLMAEDAYHIVIAALREGGEQGWLSTCFTPKGLTHWTHDRFGRERPDTALFHASTKDNPFNPPTFYDTLKLQYSGILAEQELEGRFVNVEGAEWPPEYFGDDVWFARWPDRFVLKLMALDPSMGKSDKFGDYAAFVMLGLDHDGHLWIDASLERLDSARLVQHGMALFRDWGPAWLTIENNQWQQLLSKEFLRVAADLKIHLPILGINNSVNKQLRIRRLGSYLAQRKLHFKGDSKGSRMLVAQLRDFPEGRFDDAPDALEMAVRTMNHLLGRRNEPDQPTIVTAA